MPVDEIAPESSAIEVGVSERVGNENDARRSNFGLLWLGQAVSIIGSQFSALSIQMIAATALRANPTQMGFLIACQTFPYLILSLFIGVLVDRIPRKSLLIMADVVRGAILISAAALLLTEHMTLWTLCGIVCVTSLFTLIFEASLGAVIPELFQPGERIAVNSRLNMTLVGGDVVGPSMSGYALRLAGISGAMLLDSFTYFTSAFCIFFGIRKTVNHNSSINTTAHNNGIFRSIFEGVSFIANDATLRILGIGSAIWNFSWSAILAVLVLHAVHDLRLNTVQIGLAFATGGIGGIAGSFLGWRLSRAFPQGKILVLTPLIGIAGGATLLLPAQTNAFFLTAMALFLYNLGESSFGVNMQTTRQAITPMRLMGRMDTAMRFCFKGMASLGGAAGGLTASRFGLNTTLTLGVAGLAFTFVVFFGSELSQFDNSPDSISSGALE